ncbi:Uncharacterised protein [uncultured archaeon]|nr:Uncharacterised protein [uncultured archaeon]
MASKILHADNHLVNKVKTFGENIFDEKVAALEKARKEFPKALDNYVASLGKNGVETGHLRVVLRHLEMYDPALVVQLLKDVAKDGGMIGNVQDYVIAFDHLGPDFYPEVRKDCWKDGGKYGKLLAYASALMKYGDAVYREARIDCIKDKGALGNLSDYAWALAVFEGEYTRVRKKLADGEKIGDDENFSHMRKTSGFDRFHLR